MTLSISTRKKFLLLLAAALGLRICFACTFRGFESDTACFFSWATLLWENGFSNFYSPDYFCDYPPGYLYILWAQGGLMHLFGLGSLTAGSLLILKLPAILCDIATGYLIYHFSSKNFSPTMSMLICAGYLFHPAVLTNSSLWGQVDAVFTLLIIIVCILLSKGIYIPAYYLYGLGILLKPQVLFFAPLILCALAEYSLNVKDLKKVLTNILGGLGAIATLFILSLPFGLENVISQYTDTLTSYAYAAVNACNIWGLFGQNWISQDTMLGIFSYGQIGTIVLVIITLVSFYLFYRLRNRSERYYLTGAFLIISIFIFSVRMHERYMFPSMLLLLFAFIHNREKAYYVHFWLLSLCHFGNVFYVLNYYDPSDYDRKSFSILTISALTVLCGILFYHTLVATAKGKSRPVSVLPKSKPNPVEFTLTPSREKLPLIKTDWFYIIVITLFYACFTFFNLGITKAPVSECTFPYNTYLELDALEGQSIDKIYWYLKNEQNITCRLEVRQSETSDWEYVQDVILKSVFKWDMISLPYSAVSIRLTNTTEDTNIGELYFTDASGDYVYIKQADSYYTLFDEADTFPGSLSAQTGTYFDEIYYTRTVYEYMEGLPTYENTHPPLGKVLITAGALLLGTTPFGFRFMGAFFGVLMLPFMYLFARNLTGKRYLGAFVSFIFAFDFMHFSQTRLATIDVFITFFVIAMYYCMERYSSLNFYDTPLKKTWIPLGACGIFFGLGFASKWTGAYAGAGLAVIFFMQLYKRYREYKYALNAPTGETCGIKHSHVITCFKEYTLKTIGFCIIFFVAIPFVIYTLSYIPFVDPSHPGLLERMFANQVNMLNYHSNLNATHPYSSLWYQWPAMIRPIFYYSQKLAGNLRIGISSFGNPLVWWMGIPAFIYTVYLATVYRKREAIFLSIGYLAQYLPWTLIDRCTFIYHYFPSVPFVVLMIGYCAMQLKKKVSSKVFYLLLSAYAALVLILFLMFYPVLAGRPVSTEYVDTFLRWMDTWVLVLN